MLNINSSMVEIREVKTWKEQRDFLDFPLNLYKGNPYFVPPLYGDEKSIFSKNYLYLDQAEAIYFNAYRDNKIVGRISGIIQKAANKKNNYNRVRFTRFDSIDDQEVADALFSSVEKWAKEKGMDTIVGPLGFSDLEREGLLIEGFEELSTFEEQYNYPYYQKLIENYGFEKEVDWVERKLYLPKDPDTRLERLSNLMMRRCNLRFGEAKNTDDFIKKYADKFFDILDETYDHIYGSVPFTPAMRKLMIDNFKLIVDTRFIAVILDKDDNVVAFGLCFPSLSKAIQPSQGHLTPFAIFRLLNAIKNPKILDLALIGVVEKYQKLGIASALIAKLMEMMKNSNIEYCETNLNLETNEAILNQWSAFDSVLHKRRRAFVKKITL